MAASFIVYIMVLDNRYLVCLNFNYILTGELFMVIWLCGKRISKGGFSEHDRILRRGDGQRSF